MPPIIPFIPLIAAGASIAASAIGGAEETQKTTSAPSLSPEEQRLRTQLEGRLFQSITEANPARQQYLSRLGAMENPVRLDPRIAGILSVMTPQISGAQVGMQALTERLLGGRKVGGSNEQVLAPYKRFLDVTQGPPVTTPASRITMTSQLDELRKRLQEVLQQQLSSSLPAHQALINPAAPAAPGVPALPGGPAVPGPFTPPQQTPGGPGSRWI